MYVLRAPGWGVDAVNEGAKKKSGEFLTHSFETCVDTGLYDTGSVEVVWSIPSGSTN